MRATPPVRRFLEWNRRISRALTPAHVHDASVFGGYVKLGALLLSHPRVSRVADIGAGRRWHFPAYYKAWYGIHLIGLDIDAEEMAPNELLDEKIVCDVVQGIPVPPGSLDLVMVRAGIEHFSDNGAFLRHAHAALRPGGFLLAQFPGRYAPFAIANRLLPRRAARWFLHGVMGASPEELGFRAHYDRTHYSGFRALSAAAGFAELHHAPGYFSAPYVEQFVPAYLLYYLYDSLCFAAGARNLASYHLWLLQKPDPTGLEDAEPLRLHAWR